MKNVTNGFNTLSLAEFRQKIDFIVSGMTNNVFYPTLQTDLQIIIADITTYKNLADAAADRGGQAIIKRDIARQQLTNKLHRLGRHVAAIADNNVEMLASSGFSYTQDKKNTPDITQPAPPLLEAGVNKGEIYCRTSKQPGMTGVNYYSTTDTTALTATDGTGWNVTSSNKVKLTLSGLPSGQRCYVKIGLIGVRGQEVFSEPVSYIPQ